MASFVRMLALVTLLLIIPSGLDPSEVQLEADLLALRSHHYPEPFCEIFDNRINQK
jgi:hypothetical protein